MKAHHPHLLPYLLYISTQHSPQLTWNWLHRSLVRFVIKHKTCLISFGMFALPTLAIPSLALSALLCASNLATLHDFSFHFGKYGLLLYSNFYISFLENSLPFIFLLITILFFKHYHLFFQALWSCSQWCALPHGTSLSGVLYNSIQIWTENIYRFLLWVVLARPSRSVPKWFMFL